MRRQPGLKCLTGFPGRCRTHRWSGNGADRWAERWWCYRWDGTVVERSGWCSRRWWLSGASLCCSRNQQATPTLHTLGRGKVEETGKEHRNREPQTRQSKTFILFFQVSNWVENLLYYDNILSKLFFFLTTLRPKNALMVYIQVSTTLFTPKINTSPSCQMSGTPPQTTRTSNRLWIRWKKELQQRFGFSTVSSCCYRPVCVCMCVYVCVCYH